MPEVRSNEVPRLNYNNMYIYVIYVYIYGISQKPCTVLLWNTSFVCINMLSRKGSSFQQSKSLESQNSSGRLYEGSQKGGWKVFHGIVFLFSVSAAHLEEIRTPGCFSKKECAMLLTPKSA